MDRGERIPEWVLDLGKDNPIIAAHFSCWRKGGWTWEEMLTHMVKALADQNARLLRDVIRLTQMQPPPIIIKDGLKFIFNDDPS